VGQIGKIMGCRVVGIAGTEEKALTRYHMRLWTSLKVKTRGK